MPNLPAATSSYSAADTKTASSSSSFSSASTQGPLQYFDNGNRNTCRPIIFKPTGSFRVLKETGKMACTEDEIHVYKGRQMNQQQNEASFVPGYTGFVRGAQHNVGRTFGAATRRALATDFTSMATTDPLPQSPQQNTQIPQVAVKDSFIEQVFGEKQYMVPGYTGFVAGVKPQFGASYGTATTTALTQKMANNGTASNISAGSNTRNSTGFASAALSIQVPAPSSNPLPGGALTHDAPNMFIPAHIKHLTYIAQ